MRIEISGDLTKSKLLAGLFSVASIEANDKTIVIGVQNSEAYFFFNENEGLFKDTVTERQTDLVDDQEVVSAIMVDADILTAEEIARITSANEIHQTGKMPNGITPVIIYAIKHDNGNYLTSEDLEIIKTELVAYTIIDAFVPLPDYDNSKRIKALRGDTVEYETDTIDNLFNMILEGTKDDNR